MVGHHRLKLLITGILALGTAWECRATTAHNTVPSDPEAQEQLMEVIQEAPVHRDILTTVFWVGESARRKGWSSNLDSAWDRRWKENFGGLDSPIYRNGYFPAAFRPKENPFYIALPFNDISNPRYLDTCPILQHFKANMVARKSVCKNRWIEVMLNDKSCFAQWQDVGPIYTDDYDYVFKGVEPKAHSKSKAGLDISPAVRDFLGIKTTCRTTWRFVHESEVPDGPWKAIITGS